MCLDPSWREGGLAELSCQPHEEMKTLSEFLGLPDGFEFVKPHISLPSEDAANS